MRFYTYKDGLKDGIPIFLGYLFVSVGFGISAVNYGIPLVQTVLISMTNLTSAGQVAGIGIIADCTVLVTSALEMFLTQLIINIRYSLMGISLSQKLDSSFTTSQRLLTSYFITDEIFAVAFSKEKEISTGYFYGLATLPFIGWTLGTLSGALLGSLLPSAISNIFSIAIYGMFLSIFVPPSTKDRYVLLTVLTAALLSCLLYYLVPQLSSGFAIIISALIGATCASLLSNRKDED